MPTPALPAPILAIAAAPAVAAALEAALRAAGAREVITGNCLTLVRQVADAAPQQVVCDLPEGEAGLLRALAEWRGVPPCAVSVIGPWVDAAAALALAEAGVCAWVPRLAPEHLGAWLVAAQARHQREVALRGELARGRELLDERKWVDRAKGLLMAARTIPEDDAFKLLRGAAMHANLKLAEVSRAVIDAARWAEAVNRAGQLRMLSQRLVALAAQRLVRVDASRARTQQAQAAERLQENLDHLAALTLAADGAAALAEAQAAWAALRATLGARSGSEQLAEADRRAERLLEAADQLTLTLEANGSRRALAIINRCGSQRMRTQRLTKDALLATLLRDDGRAERLHATMTEFERVLGEIESAPLSSPEIRAALAASREGWLNLLRALRAGDTAALVHGGDALLDHLDRLTQSCEHSLQVLMA